MNTTAEAGAQLGTAAALVRLSHLVQHVFADVSRDHGLTPQQTHLLCLLVDGPLGMTELRRLLNLERSGVSGLVDRVERRALIARRPDPADRRACRIALTEQGARLAEEAHHDVITRLETLLEEVRPADRTLLTAVVTQLLARDGAETGRPWLSQGH
jgi:DNA-binding MarR family transcriptional regulator